MAGIQDLLIRVQHQPRDARFQPAEITYNWTEHRETGDVTRCHTELVESLPHEYVINPAGFRDPTMNWVRMNLRGYSPEETRQPAYGYSDDEDLGGELRVRQSDLRLGRKAFLGGSAAWNDGWRRRSFNPQTSIIPGFGRSSCKKPHSEAKRCIAAEV